MAPEWELYYRKIAEDCRFGCIDVLSAQHQTAEDDGLAAGAGRLLKKASRPFSADSQDLGFTILD